MEGSSRYRREEDSSIMNAELFIGKLWPFLFIAPAATTVVCVVCRVCASESKIIRRNRTWAKYTYGYKPSPHNFCIHIGKRSTGYILTLWHTHKATSPQFWHILPLCKQHITKHPVQFQKIIISIQECMQQISERIKTQHKFVAVELMDISHLQIIRLLFSIQFTFVTFSSNDRDKRPMYEHSASDLVLSSNLFQLHNWLRLLYFTSLNEQQKYQKKLLWTWYECLRACHPKLIGTECIAH